jgi:CheY-like chemotaxis protein
MSEAALPRVLCVDDEPAVLEGLKLHLRRRCEVLLATSGEGGLEVLRRPEPIAVVVSDMRMPGMDGVTFLRKAKQVAPDAVRMLLTGQADLATALAGVNEGQIFRFLTKPCSSQVFVAAVEAGVEQNRLVTAERVLLEQTLHGSIDALTDLLAQVSPVAFGRAVRIKNHVVRLATQLELRERWQVEVAAMLSQVGLVALPPETLEKVYYGHPLNEAEQRMVERAPLLTQQLLGKIPRLEVVQEILANYDKPTRRSAPGDNPRLQLAERGAHILQVAADLDSLEAGGMLFDAAIDTLCGRANRYAPDVLAGLAALRGAGAAKNQIRELPLAAVRVGMVFAEDVKLTTGALLVTRDYEATASFVERVRNFRSGMVKEPVRVIIRAAKESP